MKRDRGYFREMREKHIKRKKRIANSYFYPLELKFDGMYSKGKIHCSCEMCRQKTNNGGGLHWAKAHNWKHSDAIIIEAMDKEVQEYEQVI